MYNLKDLEDLRNRFIDHPEAISVFKDDIKITNGHDSGITLTINGRFTIERTTHIITRICFKGTEIGVINERVPNDVFTPVGIGKRISEKGWEDFWKIVSRKIQSVNRRLNNYEQQLVNEIVHQLVTLTDEKKYMDDASNGKTAGRS